MRILLLSAVAACVAASSPGPFLQGFEEDLLWGQGVPQLGLGAGQPTPMLHFNETEASQTINNHESEPVAAQRSAVRAGDLAKRDAGLSPTNHAELIYIEGEPDHDKVYRTILSGPMRYPTYHLEKHNEFTVSCRADKIHLTFTDDGAFEQAKAQTITAIGSTIITAHAGCQETDDERMAFEIVDVSHLRKSKSIRFQVAPRSFRKAFERLTVEMHESEEEHVLSSELDNQAALAKRAAGTSSGPAYHAQTSLAWSKIDKQLDLPAPQTDHTYVYVTQGWRNCRQTGTLAVSAGKFEVNLLDALKPGQSMIKDGWVELDLTNYELYMDLFTLFSGGVYLFQPLEKIVGPGMSKTIPGVGHVQLEWAPAFISSFSYTSPLQVNYGMKMKLPNSKIRIDLSNPKASTIQGFQKANPELLPFSANETSAGLAASWTFMPRVPLTFSFLEDHPNENPNGGWYYKVGPFLAFPRFQIQVSGGCVGPNGKMPGETLPIRRRGLDQPFILELLPTVRLGLGMEYQWGKRIKDINPGFFTRITPYAITSTFGAQCVSINIPQNKWVKIKSWPAPGPGTTATGAASNPTQTGKAAPFGAAETAMAGAAPAGGKVAIPTNIPVARAAPVESPAVQSPAVTAAPRRKRTNRASSPPAARATIY